jgi:hypothetical protein
MHLVAMVNPPTSQFAENWRHPLSRSDWLSADFYVDLARTLDVLSHDVSDTRLMGVAPMLVWMRSVL